SSSTVTPGALSPADSTTTRSTVRLPCPSNSTSATSSPDRCAIGSTLSSTCATMDCRAISVSYSKKRAGRDPLQSSDRQPGASPGQCFYETITRDEKPDQRTATSIGRVYGQSGWIDRGK